MLWDHCFGRRKPREIWEHTWAWLPKAFPRKCETQKGVWTKPGEKKSCYLVLLLLHDHPSRLLKTQLKGHILISLWSVWASIPEPPVTHGTCFPLFTSHSISRVLSLEVSSFLTLVAQ